MNEMLTITAIERVRRDLHCQYWAKVHLVVWLSGIMLCLIGKEQYLEISSTFFGKKRRKDRSNRKSTAGIGE